MTRSQGAEHHPYPSPLTTRDPAPPPGFSHTVYTAWIPQTPLQCQHRPSTHTRLHTYACLHTPMPEGRKGGNILSEKHWQGQGCWAGLKVYLSVGGS